MRYAVTEESSYFHVMMQTTTMGTAVRALANLSQAGYATSETQQTLIHVLRSAGTGGTWDITSVMMETFLTEMVVRLSAESRKAGLALEVLFLRLMYALRLVEMDTTASASIAMMGTS